MKSVVQLVVCLLVIFVTGLIATPNYPVFKDLNSNQISKIGPIIKKQMYDYFEGKASYGRLERRSLTHNQVRAIVYTNNPAELIAVGIEVNSVLPEFVTVHASFEQLLSVTSLNSVSAIQSERILTVNNDVARGLVGAELLHSGFLNSTEYQGENVIVCIYDTGIDFEHLDFRDPADPTKSRILYLWDQTLSATGGESAPSETGCNFGVEYTQAQIEDEMNDVTSGFVREQDINGHGTHVAGSAAGNGASLSSKNYAGMAPKADIIIVKGGDGSFSSADVIDALTYIREKATALGKPVVVNFSIGSQSGPHDGSDAQSQAIDYFVDAGRAVIKSAGNEGNDLIHKSGTLPANSTTSISFTLPSFTAESGSDNDDIRFEIWFESNADIKAQIESPGGNVATVNVGEDRDVNRAEGSIFISNYMDGGSGDRYMKAIVYDGISTVTPVPGEWKINLTSYHGTDLDYHIWFSDVEIGTEPQTVTIDGADANYTVTGAASECIAVGSYTHRWYWLNYSSGTKWGGYDHFIDDISTFSSKGPTRDNREKPDIVAPGDKIVSSMSQWSSPSGNYIVPGQKHLAMQGTSMSSPVVTGAAALLFEQNPNLTHSQLLSLLTDNADLDDYTGATVWDPSWGYGKLNILKSMGDVLGFTPDAQSEVLVYDQSQEYGHAVWIGTGTNMFPKISVRFSPSIAGQVTGCYIQTSMLSDDSNIYPLTGTLDIEIWTNVSGKPGAKLAGSNTVSISAANVAQYSMQYFNLQDANVSVDAGTSYHIVLSLSNSSDKLAVLAENLVSPDYRSHLYSSSSWTNALTSFDFVIRPVVTNGSGTIVPVTLASLSAVIAPQAGAVIKWQTKSEIRNLGFNVLRAAQLNGPWEKVNKSIISGAGTTASEQNYEFIDNGFNGKYTVYYMIEQMDTDGFKTVYGPVKLEATDTMVPNVFALRQNYPNPFNTNTTIEYDVPQARDVNISVFNTRGELVNELYNAKQTTGSHRMVWDGTEQNGNLAASGIYFIRMQAGDFNKTFKMLFAK